MAGTGRGPEVGEILERLGLQSLASRFAAQDVDAEVLFMLTDADLRELGLTLGQRRKLLAEILRLRDRDRTVPPLPLPRVAAPAMQIRDGLELRRLTVAIADLVGSTELATRLGPDEMHEVLQAYYNHARTVAERHGGHFQPLQGDGAILLFGYPKSKGATAERAVEAAMQLQAELASSPHVLADGSSVTLRARIGVATGKAMVGYAPDAGPHDGLQIVGPVVNRAARLQVIGDPGAVLADAPTAKLAAGFAVEDMPPARLKGFDEAVAVVRVIGRRIAPAELPAPRLAVQSAHRLDAANLTAMWRRASAGGAALAVVTGDAGIGKSTLLAQVQALAARDGARILRLGCSALGANTPLGPVTALVRAAAAEGGDGDVIAALGRLFAFDGPTERDEIAALLGLTAGETTRPSERGRLLGLLAARMLDGGGRASLLVVEDLHWADATTRDLLEACALRVQGQGVMILGSSRKAEEGLWSADPRREVVALSPLAPDAARDVLQQVLGKRVLPDAIAGLILARCDGNPLMVEALARKFEAWSDAELHHEMEVPTSIYESISARVDGLAKGAGLAEALSVFDAPVAEGTLALAVDLGASALADAATELCAVGIAEWVGDGRQRFLTFRHSLYREVIYERIVRASRQRLHRAAYRALLAGDALLADEMPAVLAWHAAEAGEYAQAAPLALKAGEAALARSALIEAGHHFDRAIAALERVARSRPVDMLRLRALAGMASVKRAREGIASDEAGRLGRAVLALARDLGETRTEMLALNGLYSHALVRADYRAAGAWANELDAAAAQSQDATFRMISTRAMGVVALHTGTPAEGATLLQRALDAYDRERHVSLAFAHGYDHAEICAVFLSFALWLKGDLVGSAQVGAFSVRHSREIDHAHSLAQALTFRGMLLSLARDEAGAIAAAREGAEVGARFDLRAMHGVGEFLAEAAALVSSDAPVNGEALDALRARHLRFREVNPFNYLPMSLSLVAAAEIGAGDFAAAEATLAEAEAIQERAAEIWTRPEVTRVKALLALAKGDTGAARALLSAGYADALDMGAVTLQLRLACDMALTEPADAEARQKVADALARLVSQDGGWDVARAQAIVAREPV